MLFMVNDMLVAFHIKYLVSQILVKFLAVPFNCYLDHRQELFMNILVHLYFVCYISQCFAEPQNGFAFLLFLFEVFIFLVLGDISFVFALSSLK